MRERWNNKGNNIKKQQRNEREMEQQGQQYKKTIEK